MPRGCAGRIRPEIVAGFPIIFWPNGSRAESSTTIGADVVQNKVDTIAAEGAFERADHCSRRIRRQRRVAILAGWS